MTGTALLLSACGGNSSAKPSASSTAGDYFRHEDRAAGFSIVYPASWHFYKAADPGIQLRVGPNDTTNASVRVVPFPAPADGAARRAVVEQLLSTVVIVDETATTIHGVPGWQVAYGVPETGNMDVHIHIFLFAPTKLHTIVFQTPRAELQKYAHVFDLMRDSYTVLGAATATPAPSPVPSAIPTG